MASCARRFGRNPYEQGRKCASKMGSRTSLSAACTIRSVTVGMPSFRNFPDALGIITCRTGTGRNSPDLSKPRMWPRYAGTATQLTM